MAQSKDRVVAKLNKDEIRQSEVDAIIKLYAKDLAKFSPGERASVALDRLIDARLVAEEARDRKLDKRPAVKVQLEEAERRILQQALLGDLVAEATSEKALKQRYEQDYDKGKGKKEVRARHILTYTQGTAEAIIEELSKGADFAKLAREKSVDPAGKTNGGDLGWFSRGDMVPAFAMAAYELEPGEVTKKPVETEFGWHVIKVEEIRRVKAPPFDKVKAELEQQATQEAVVGLLTELRRKAKIEKVY